MPSSWVDFRTVKQAVTVHMVLDHYEVRGLKESRGELRGRCPISKCKDDDPFSANVSKNCFQCFSCKRKGNVLDFVAAMEKCSVRDAALKLAEWFSVPNGNGNEEPAEQSAAESRGESAAGNMPLTFELKGVDPAHEYLRERGITQETAETFSAGFFSGKGSMSGRVVIPIHNSSGELVAYAGRAIDGSEPKYKLPTGFQKSLELFNLHRLQGSREVVLVEGFFDCMKIWQAGFPGAALMGSSLSEQQERLLVQRFQVAVLLLDGDEAGQRATDECLLRLGRRMWVKAVVVPQGKQPDQLSSEELNLLLT